MYVCMYVYRSTSADATPARHTTCFVLVSERRRWDIWAKHVNALHTHLYCFTADRACRAAPHGELFSAVASRGYAIAYICTATWWWMVTDGRKESCTYFSKHVSTGLCRESWRWKRCESTTLRPGVFWWKSNLQRSRATTTTCTQRRIVCSEFRTIYV